jgi:hypothetical protein
MRSAFQISLLLCIATVGMAQTADSAAANAWTQADKSDALHGTSFREFRLAGRFLVPPQHASIPAPVMVLHCQPGPHGFGNGKTNGHFVEGWIAAGAVLDSAKPSAGKNFASLVPVEFRLDDKKLQSDFWPVSTDYSGIFLNEPACGFCNLANVLYGHGFPHKEGTGPQVRKVIIGVPEYLAIQIQMQFDLPDSTEVAEACGIITHKSR